MASTLDVPALAKGFNLVVLALCVVCSVAFVIGYHSYFSVLIGVEVSVLAAFQLAIELGQPVSFLDMLRASLPGVLGLNGQLVTSIVLVLFLFGMGTFGIVRSSL
ncbi:hypothetical protein M885DRAFT_517362 [Pelagophyceae sp. CCMP2097]|nr:hypothetical protein M885DRAFT_517362 [Pelagophyceae sp. CCMP2097]